MKKAYIFILIAIVSLSIAIYHHYHQVAHNNIVVSTQSQELVDTSIDESISNRILAVYPTKSYYYYLGYDGIGRYDIKNHILDVLEFEIYGDESGPFKTYHPKSKMVVNKKNTLYDFSKEDLDNFEKMLMDSEHNAQYFNKRWYRSGYEATFLDLDNHLIITNDVRGVKNTPTKILIFNVSGFIIIDKETNDIQVYFDESIAGKKARDSAVSILKHVYGEHLIILNSIDQIGEDEKIILLQLRDQYISKK
ncbi:hypothetical protein [Veillonella sp. T34266-5]|uniref:hypothetical protein n=1 Tax=Veillonella sp. T34266-5 TaxID=2027457 RepID=UPI000CF3BD4D|nr:hypothetical protein [Veillonella sp. T34266-5]PQL23188.1 hypothetical protein VIHSUH07_03860 [Veillonella sp. T34266-5]